MYVYVCVGVCKTELDTCMKLWTLYIYCNLSEWLKLFSSYFWYMHLSVISPQSSFQEPSGPKPPYRAITAQYLLSFVYTQE